MKLAIKLFTKELPKCDSQASRIWNLLFGKYLLVTNIVSSGLYMGVGDVISQQIQSRNKTNYQFDWKRLSRMVVVGSTLGPLHHYAYKWMDAKFVAVNIGNVAKKILLDQTFMCPTCIVVFFSGSSILEGKTYSQATTELKAKFLTVYRTDWMVWPPTQFINFYYLSPRYRVAYVNFVTMLYDIFLSSIKHRNVEDFTEEQKHIN